MTKRNTKQKEIILDILQQHRIHPTTHEIYMHAKEKFPNIGQATVYRNINNLVQEGLLIKLPNTNSESYHYDINIKPHSHLICNCCGKIVDIFDNDYENVIKRIEKNNKLKIDNITVILEGICPKCMK